MSYEAHKVIDKEFEKMIDDMCGDGRLPVRKNRPTQDFYDLPFQHEDFMKWYDEKTKERYSTKITAKCDCGATYKVFTEQVRIEYPTWSDAGTGTASYSYTDVEFQRFFCWKCGKPFVVTGSKIVKIKSNQLEVVL